jgi:cytochrome c oxidase subunit 4
MAQADSNAQAEGQQHPIGVYFKVWAWLFVLSAGSYAVDYFHVQSYLRWTLILVFMMAKASLIVAVFMHMKWERLAFIYAITVPPVLVMVFMFLMTFEADYTFLTRGIFFSAGN